MSTKTSSPPPSKPKPKSLTDPTPNADVPKKGVSVWVKAFVAFHILAITIWSIPNPPQAFLNGAKWQVRTDSVPAFTQSLNDGFRVFASTNLKHSIVQYYLLFTGFWQYWDMFAPNPADVNFYCDANVIFQDGSHLTFTYPRMYKLGIIQKYPQERFRKYYERARDDAYQYTWQAFAQRVALLSTTNPNNPPVEVRLVRHWRDVAPPGKPQPQAYESYEYMRYAVNQVKLRHDLAGGD